MTSYTRAQFYFAPCRTSVTTKTLKYAATNLKERDFIARRTDLKSRSLQRSRRSSCLILSSQPRTKTTYSSSVLAPFLAQTSPQNLRPARVWRYKIPVDSSRAFAPLCCADRQSEARCSFMVKLSTTRQTNHQLWTGRFPRKLRWQSSASTLRRRNTALPLRSTTRSASRTLASASRHLANEDLREQHRIQSVSSSSVVL